MKKFNTEDQTTFDTCIEVIVSSERATWEAINTALKMAIAHVQGGGNIATVNKVIKSVQTGRRKELLKFGSFFLAFETDSKAVKLTKKLKNAEKKEARKMADFQEWLGKKQNIQTWLKADAEKNPVVKTQAQKDAQAAKGIERMLKDGVSLTTVMTACVNHDGISIADLMAVLTAMSQPAIAEAA